MRKRDKLGFMFSENKIYLYVTALVVIALARYNMLLAFIGFILLCFLIYHNLKTSAVNKEALRHYMEGLSKNLDTATKQAIINIPIPMAIIDNTGAINWYNSSLTAIFQGVYLLNQHISDLIDDISIDDIIGEEKSDYDRVLINDKYYDISCIRTSVVDGDISNIIVMLYFIDKTDLVELEDNFELNKTVIITIEIDNYEEMQKEIPDDKRPILNANVDQSIQAWSAKHFAFIQKHGNGRYAIITTNEQLAVMQDKRFDILDTIRELNTENNFQITLSIGVGVGADTNTLLQDYARSALDLALGRGGDQAVVKDNTSLSYYGGKTKALEKRTRVRARVISHALRQLMMESQNIIIMGHEMPDLDCLGAALGVYRCAKQLDRDAKIVLNKRNASIISLMNSLDENAEYNTVFVNNPEALSLANENTLLIVVDVHRPSFTECKALLDKAGKVVIIDHHRRSHEIIENPAISYIEPYASSTSELISELLQYMFDRVRMNQIEAEALLAGIFIDTKNFAFQTGVRTFEAASFLRRMGADTTLTRQLFQDDLGHFIDRAEVVKEAIIYRDNIAISQVSSNVKNVSLIAAQAADELLNIRGISASFVLSSINDFIYISGRSLGGINVQVVLEKLGGGGHLTVAGAQLSDISQDEAVIELKKVIDEYIEEEERE